MNHIVHSLSFPGRNRPGIDLVLSSGVLQHYLRASDVFPGFILFFCCCLWFSKIWVPFSSAFCPTQSSEAQLSTTGPSLSPLPPASPTAPPHFFLGQKWPKIAFLRVIFGLTSPIWQKIQTQLDLGLFLPVFFLGSSWVQLPTGWNSLDPLSSTFFSKPVFFFPASLRALIPPSREVGQALRWAVLYPPVPKAPEFRKL